MHSEKNFDCEKFVNDFIDILAKHREEDDLFKKFSYFTETENDFELFLTGQSLKREISYELREFLNQILKINPKNRISV